LPGLFLEADPLLGVASASRCSLLCLASSRFWAVPRFLGSRSFESYRGLFDGVLFSSVDHLPCPLSDFSLLLGRLVLRLSELLDRDLDGDFVLLSWL
jgi:hypothetical protein